MSPDVFITIAFGSIALAVAVAAAVFIFTVTRKARRAAAETAAEPDGGTAAPRKATAR